MAKIITDNLGSSFLIKDYIDKGSFSKVYSLECCSTKARYAGKFISKEKLQRCGIIDKVWDEIKIHQMLRHKNIVRFLTYMEQQSHIIIVLEYCSEYSMVNVLHTLKTLTPGEAKYFMTQTVSAVEYLHTNHIVHRDLKLGNLFVNDQLQIKLGDFGLAVMLEYEGQKRFSRCGTPNYIAPEMINGVGHSYEVDIWALGCILHTMLEGTPPFQGQNTTSTYNNILNCHYRFSPTIDQAAKTFIFSSLQLDPKCRPTIFELLRFEFLVSTKIISKPPAINLSKDDLSPLLRKRRKTETEPKRSFSLKSPKSKLCPKDRITKLTECLVNAKKWPESNFGEFLAETSSIKPLLWINSWMDYTNTYGFVYQLSNNNYGINFNDNTRMLFMSHDQTIRYVKRNGSVFICSKNNIPAALEKKVNILLRCGKFMSESLVQAHEGYSEVTSGEDFPEEVFKWARTEGEQVMFLTNGSIQVNFSSDHSKLILCGCTKTVTVIERVNYMKTLKLDTVQKFGCSKALKLKLLTVLKYINGLLSRDKRVENRE